jgi:LuxR family transcriptional regulator, maltose regulon positive regulatory protein
LTVGIDATPAGVRVAPWFQPPATSPLDLRRDRLVEVLFRDAAPVTLVCAPAGFGKTSLLASWAGQSPEGAIAWLSLDRHDNDPGRLWSGLLGCAACHRTVPRRIRHLHELLAPAGEIDPGFVDGLLQEVASLGEPLWLVLDDVQVVRHPKALASLELLLRRRPEPALVLSGRAEPPIGLPRLRVRGALKEIRTRDLAFTLEETAALVLRHEVGLSDADLEVLHAPHRRVGRGVADRLHGGRRRGGARGVRRAVRR